MDGPIREAAGELVLLEVPNEGALEKLCDRIEGVRFQEPDLGGELTAVAVCHTDAERLLSDLPLAPER